MSQIAINTRNSIFLDGNGQIAIVSNRANSYPDGAYENLPPVSANSTGEATRQDVLERLSTWQGEDWINRLFGIPYTNLFEDRINLTYFLTDLQRNILQCFGVVSLLDFTWSFGEGNEVSDLAARQSRDLNVEFSIQSTSGQLDFSTTFPTNGQVIDRRINI